MSFMGITNNPMPDVYGKCPRLRGPVVLAHLFQPQEGLSEEARAFRMLIVRLVDKAIIEYSRARIELQNQINEAERPVSELMKGRIIYMFEFMDHIESCINATHRALMLSKEIHRDATAPRLDEKLRGRIGQLSHSLKAIRHSLEHPEERVQDGRLGRDGPLSIMLSDDGRGVVLGPDFLSFEELAEILQATHELALKLLN